MRVAFLHNQPSEDPSHQAEDDPDNSPIVTALERNGHNVARIACTLDLLQLRGRLEQIGPEVVFNRVDSLGGSDAMQAAVTLLLDAMRLPYTGCSTAAIVATASKIATKELLAGAGLPTPGWVTAEGNDCGLRIADCGLKTPPQSAIHNPKFLLKSVYEHASFQINDASVFRPETSEQLANHLRRREAKTGRPFFAEEYIDGREFNLALWGDKPESLPPAEIDFSAFPAGKPKIVGHSAKWDTNSFEYDRTPHRFGFPPEDGPLLRRLDDLAIECWQLFGLRGYARVDFRVDHHGQPWILEINTNPCLSPGAGFSVALQQAGIAYDEGIQRILEMAAPAHLQSPPAIACMNQPSRAPARSPRSTSTIDG